MLKPRNLGLAVVATLLVAASSQEAEVTDNTVYVEVSGVLHIDDPNATVTLVNDAPQAIYLPWTFPGPVAVFERRWEATGEWELGKGPIQCGTVENPNEPRVVGPHSRIAVPVAWDAFWTDERGERVFRTNMGDRLNRLGRYRVGVSYALEPWIIGSLPDKTFHAVSREVEIAE